MGVAREHYLRTDFPCQTEICFDHCADKTILGKPAPKLPGNVTHYPLPLEDVAKNMFDVLDFTELTGILFLQSVVKLRSAPKHAALPENLLSNQRS